MTLLWSVFLACCVAVVLAGSAPDLSPQCLLCGVAMSEMEGLLAEGLTETEIEAELTKVCAMLPAAGQTLCQVAVAFVPEGIKLIQADATVDGVCMKLGLCTSGFWNGTDMTPMPVYVVDLDLPAEQRWSQVWNEPMSLWTINTVIDSIGSVLGAETMSGLADLGDLLLDTMHPTYAAEIRGGAAAVNRPAGLIAMVNIAYEATSMCTSIIAQQPDGSLLHVRNLDLGMGMGMTDLLRNSSYIINYTRGGQLLYQSVQFPAFVGVLTAMKPGSFAASVNTRFLPGSPLGMVTDIIAAIQHNASMSAWLLRHVFEQETEWSAAASLLETWPVTADIYYSLSGMQNNEGVIIARNRSTAQYEWTLNAPDTWYQGITNWDRVGSDPIYGQPWIDRGRYYEVVTMMNATTQDHVSFSTMMDILSTPPVFNLQTTMSVLMHAQTGYLAGYRRYCDISSGKCPE